MSDITAETTAPRTPWGLWATLGWVILAFVLSVIAGIVVLLIWRPDAVMSGNVDMLKDGPLISITTIASAAVQVGILALAARLARWPAGEYLGLVRPATRPALIAIAILIVFLLGYDALTYLLGRDIVTPFQVDTYRTARDSGTLPLSLLWLTFVFAAPVAEEIMFRGFLFRGWVRSERSAIPGILVISLLFAAIHVQYDWFGILQVFLGGLLLGWLRWGSGSTLLTFWLHALTNIWATAQSAIKVEWLS
jgi:membrane protease YdiL (CAAX protease family)